MRKLLIFYILHVFWRSPENKVGNSDTKISCVNSCRLFSDGMLKMPEDAGKLGKFLAKNLGIVTAINSSSLALSAVTAVPSCRYRVTRQHQQQPQQPEHQQHPSSSLSMTDAQV
jgi:hypothetical protein